MFFRKRKKVVVGMSGGVDSSVTALLLKKKGYDVVGVFMKNFSEDSLELSDFEAKKWKSQCPWKQDMEDVRSVCDQLDIPYYTLNFEKEYKERVLDYFFEESRKARTPNPDILCNSEIKFQVFLEKALKLYDADYLATGHYADVRHTKHGGKLLIPKDLNKDQTYFLHRLTSKQLSSTIFPLAKYTKKHIRQIAEKHNLVNKSKKDSQGICFVGEVDIQEFLATKIPHTKGKVITTSGEEVGEHLGLAFYTIGQRGGLHIGGRKKPLYVCDKDLKNNTLIVCEGSDHPALFASSLLASDIHWIGEKPDFPLTCQARIRYRQELQDVVVRIDPENKDVLVARFPEKQRAITPGQSLVLYKKGEVLGGAVIDQIVK